MITLIDRADGTPMLELSAEDFLILQKELVLESDQDFDYYLNDGTLQLLASAGLSEVAVTVLSSRMRHRGMDVGWEQPTTETAYAFSGSVADSEGRALGGIRVDLVSPQSDSIINWTYSRPDGTFRIGSASDDAELFLRFSGRGDLILREIPVGQPGDQGQFEVQTLRGTVLRQDESPLPGVTVSLTDWRGAEDRDSTSWTALGGQRSWGDTDDQGRFSIPVSLPEDVGQLEVDLEITTVEGQTLEIVVATLSLEDGFDLGILHAPEPAAETVSAE